MDFENIPVEDNYFDFVYCRHVLEDLNYPLHAYKEITRVSKNGYFETPSPLIESLRLGLYSDVTMRGYVHHRYLLWTDINTNILYALPKFPLIDHIVPTVYGNVTIERLALNIAIGQSYAWNNYYAWYDDETQFNINTNTNSNSNTSTNMLQVPNKKANGLKIIKHDIDYSFDTEFSSGSYAKIIRKGIQTSLIHTIKYAEEEINPFLYQLEIL